MQILFLKKILDLLYILYLHKNVWLLVFYYRSMMKKNLFVLFSLYFFVLQPIFLWLLFWSINFFYLSAINFVFILIIALIAREKKEEKLDKKIDNVEKIHNIQKNKSSKKISHVWFFVISVLFGFFVWFWLWELVMHIQLLIVVASSFILFILFGLLFKFKSFKVWESKLYMLILIVLLVWSTIKLLGINIYDFSNQTNLEEFENTWNNISFVSVDEDLTWDMIDEVDVKDNLVIDIDIDKKATFADAIKYLLEKNQTELSTLKNIKFTYISYSDLDYSYFKTAYDKRMIWKTLNPSKNLLCETYIVMMWLVEDWSVIQGSDIKKSYWNYAKSNNKLPTCNYWEFLTMAELN